MDLIGKQCPVCSRSFREEDDIVVCPKCGAPYHRECYKEKGKCIFKDLHASGKSWREVYDKETVSEKEKDTIKCPDCGEENPKNAIICRRCGSFISGTVSDGVKQPAEQNESADNKDSNDDGFPFEYGGGVGPFSFFLDPMGGVSKDENFDGVSGAEVSKYVNTNTSYYLPVFAKIKKQNKSKFNFAAFFFAGAWHLYRKQYLKGALITAVYFLLEIAVLLFAALISSPLFKEASSFFTEADQTYVTIGDYFSWAMTYKSFWEVILMFMPYIIYILLFAVRLICGFTANRGYYKFTVAKIKKTKSKCTDGNTLKAISEAGGVNNAVAWMFFACYLILQFASMFM